MSTEIRIWKSVIGVDKLRTICSAFVYRNLSRHFFPRCIRFLFIKRFSQSPLDRRIPKWASFGHAKNFVSRNRLKDRYRTNTVERMEEIVRHIGLDVPTKNYSRLGTFSLLEEKEMLILNLESIFLLSYNTS